MKLRQISVLLAVLGAVWPGSVALSASTPVPPGGGAAHCILLFGGGGTVTPNDDVNSRWFVLNRAVSKDVGNALIQRGYSIREYIVDIRDADRRLAALIQEVQETKCTKILQISDALKSTEGNQGRVDEFSFAASVLHLSSKSGGIGTVESDYSKDYPFPLTQEVMKNLSLSELSSEIAADVDKAGVLPRNKQD